MDFKAIGQRIKSKRRAVGLTQEALAEKLDISVEYLSRVEGGNANASFTLLEKISDVLTLGEEELLFGRDVSDESSDFTAAFRNLTPEKQYAVMKIVRIISDI